MTLQQIETAIRSAFKVKIGGATNVTRAAPVRDALLALVDYVRNLGTGGSDGGSARDPFDISTAKANDVIAAYEDAGGPVEETAEAFFGCEFVDDNSSAGDEFLYRCTPSRPADSSGSTTWKWRRYLETGV